MTKKVIIQYSDLQEEIKGVRRRIGDLEKQIAEMEVSGYTEADSVKGGEGGTRNYHIEGFPYQKYSKKKTLLYARKSILETLEYDLLEMTNDVEEFITTIQDSKMRRILTMRFIDGMSFEQIGNILCYDRTSISKKIDKFMEE